MDRVFQLLDPSNDAFSYRQALLRLWIIAANQQTLNEWELRENEQTITTPYNDFLTQFQDEQAIGLSDITAHPLALIRALDDYLASTQRLDTHSTTPSQSAYAISEDGKAYWLVPVTLAVRRQAVLDTQSPRLGRWFHRHAVLPSTTTQGIKIKVTASRSRLDTSLHSLTSQANAKLKVWVAHFDDTADVVWDRTLSPLADWRSVEVLPHAARRDSMLQTIAHANQAGAHIVVFPEFTLDLNHRKQLTAELRQNPCDIQLIVAGAFHEPEKANCPSPAYNTAPVYTDSGKPLFTHQKLRRYGKTSEGFEFIYIGNTMHVLVTPIGCMTVLICKDFLDEDPRVDNLLEEVPVDWVWVPSYGEDTTLKKHKERAQKLATQKTGLSCAVANTQNTAKQHRNMAPTPIPGFGHRGGEKTACDVPNSGGLVEFELTKQSLPAIRQNPKLSIVPKKAH